MLTPAVAGKYETACQAYKDQALASLDALKVLSGIHETLFVLNWSGKFADDMTAAISKKAYDDLTALIIELGENTTQILAGKGKACEAN